MKDLQAIDTRKDSIIPDPVRLRILEAIRRARHAECRSRKTLQRTELNAAVPALLALGLALYLQLSLNY